MPGYWNAKTDLEILSELTTQLSITNFFFIGRYKINNSGFTYFDNIRLPNFSPLPKIRSNIDDKLAYSKILLRRKDLKIGTYYLFTAKIIPQYQRVKYNNDFLFTVENENDIAGYAPDVHKFTDSIFERFDKADSANNNDISKALNTITYQINKKPETFIYELLQNADDNAGNKDVNVTFYITDKYLLFVHDGEPFRFNNVFAICSVNAEDKSEDIDKIGFKGIGFKSVFKDNDWVFIKSGEYNFRFDQSKYSVEKPWQLMPIWTPVDENLEISIRHNNRFLNNNVAIALRPKGNNIKLLNNYSKTLELFKDDRILLFLRNVRQVHVSLPNKEKIDCRKNENIWRSNNYIVTVRGDIKIWLNEQIRNNNQEVPSKYQDIDKFKISFAYKIENNKIVQLNDSTLFNYLPLSISLGFPFLVNADFIPDGDREELYLNIWNEYLMIEIGNYLPIFISEISKSRNDCFILLPDIELDSLLSSKWKQLYSWFLKGFEESIKSDKAIPFIHTAKGKLETLSNILIDETGLSEFVKDDFQKITNNSKELISPSIGEGLDKIKVIANKFQLGNIYRISDLINDIKKPIFIEWLKSGQNNIIFIKYISVRNIIQLFSSETIFLGADGELYKAVDLYNNLGKDNISLKWLNYKKILEPTVLNGLGDNFDQLPLKHYDATSFIKEVICGTCKKEIEQSLISNIIPFEDFYYYLSLYADHALFPVKEIMQFPLQTKQGIILNWLKPIYFSSAPLNLLLLTKSIPDSLFHTLDERWSQISDSSLKILAEKLGVILFKESEPFSFINSILLTNKVQIINYFQSQDKISLQTNAALWSFIINSFDNLSPNQIDELKTTFRLFPILSKKGSYKALHFLYLSSAYTDNDALENLSNQFPNADVDFINADYLQHIVGDKTKIKKYFKQLDAKEETRDFLLHTLLPNLHQIEENLFIPLTRLIYENRESEEVLKAVITSNHFKLKTKEGTFKPIKDCYLGSPYIDETQIPNPLDFVPLANQLAAEYTVSHLDAWQRFFAEKLKVTELRNETEILNLKLKTISDNLELWKERQKSISLLKELYSLFKSGNLSLSITNLTYIKRIPLLCKGDESNFCISNTIHFSSTFKPTFDFEKIFGLECGIPFLSDLYKFEDDAQLISFFEQVGITQYFDQNRHNILLQNIPTADGQTKPASQLFKYELKKYVGPSNVTFEDLSKIVYNGQTLEYYFGFKSKLDVSTILNYISTNQPDKRELKELIIELLKVCNLSNNNDKIQINTFVSSGKLLSTAKIYNSVNSLYSIDESIRSGIRENEFLIDPLFNKQELDNRKKYFNLFNIKSLGIDDFNPHFEGEHMDYDFTNRVKERLVFLAFDSDSEKYLEVEKEFKEKFQEWKINKCSKISLKYPAIDSKIVKEDNRNSILPNIKTIFYIGNWIEQRNYVLVDWLKDKILLIQKQLQFVQDILLNDPLDIITDFEKKGRNVPEEIKQRFRIVQTIQQNKTIPLPTRIENNIDELIEDDFENPFIDIPEADEGFIRSIIKGDFELNEKLDVNTTAKIKTLMKIRNEYPLSEISDEGRFIKAGKDEILVRSAQKGLLYLDVYHWSKLNEINVRLAVYTKNKIEIYSTQEELIRFTKPQNNFGIVRMPVEYSTEDYNSLGNISDKGKWHFVFIVNENTKAAKYYKEVMNLDDYNF